MPNIIYVAPKRSAIDKTVRLSCKELAQRNNDKSYRDYEVMTGMSEFVRVIAEMKAQQMNKKSEQKRSA